MPFSLQVASSFHSITNLHQTNTGNSSSTQAPAFSLRNIRFGGISAFPPVVRLRRTSRRFLFPRPPKTLFFPPRESGERFQAPARRFSFPTPTRASAPTCPPPAHAGTP